MSGKERGGPSQPPNLRTSVQSDTSIRVQWDVPSDDGGSDIFRYELKYWMDGSREPDSYRLVSQNPDAVPNRHYTMHPQTPGTWTVAVRAMNRDGLKGDFRRLDFEVEGVSHEPTGKPTISGKPLVNEFVSVGIGDIKDGDGTPSKRANHKQWRYALGEAGQSWPECGPRFGQSESTLRIPAYLRSDRIEARVCFLDLKGTWEAVTSDAWPTYDILVQEFGQAFLTSAGIGTGTNTVLGLHLVPPPTVVEGPADTYVKEDGSRIRIQFSQWLNPTPQTYDTPEARGPVLTGRCLATYNPEPRAFEVFVDGESRGAPIQIIVEGCQVGAWNFPNYVGTGAWRPFHGRPSGVVEVIVPGGEAIRAGQTVRLTYTDTNPGSNVNNELHNWAGIAVESFTIDVPNFARSGPPTLSVSPAEATEGDDSFISFTVKLEPASPENVTVDYRTRDGTATAPDDYAARSGTLLFQAGDTTRQVNFRIVDDAHEDNNEFFFFELSNAEGAQIGVGLSRGTIHNDEGAVVTGVSVTSGPGGNGTWDTGETVDAEVRFSAPVTVTAPPGTGPVLTVLLDGVAREAAYTGGTGTAALTFRHTVTAADDGATRARVAANGLSLNGTVLGDALGQTVETGFSVAPWVTAVEIAPDASGDREWTPGESIEARLTFSEAVTVAGGSPWLGVSVGADAATLAYASGSGSTVLVFSRAVTESDGSLSEIGVTADSLSLDGASIVSQASGMAAELVHDGTEATAAAGEPGSTDALTAAFEDMPDSHGGAEFTFTLAFSEEFGVSYATLRDEALTATGGTVSAVRRATTGENRVWTVTVTPQSGAGDVTVTLAATADCAAEGAVCAGDGRALSAAVSAVVPEAVSSATPFRVRLVDAPGEHDGSGEVVFEVAFNKQPENYSYVTMRDATLKILRGGTALTPKVRRLNRPHSDRWEVTVAPGGKEDVRVSVGPFAACSETGAVCAADGEVLSNEVVRTILGPPGLSVADARVYEADGATVDFAVTLGRASDETVTVDYATSDGTASAGSDYEAASGTLTFAPGETAKTVAVAVLNDAHDEGEETFVLTLSNPQGGNAWLKDAEATGMIENTDAMPEAWLARFGRTVAEQAIEAVEGRFAAPRNAGVEMTVAGERIGWTGGTDAEPGERAQLAGEREARGKLETMTQWLRGADDGDGEDAGSRAGLDARSATARDLLTGSSFALTGEAKSGGLVSLWGRGAVSRFDGREGDLSLDGEVASAMMGADWARDRWTAGLFVSRSEGEGSYRGQGAPGSGSGTGGTVSSTLTAFWPYGRYAVNDRLTVWGMAGYGAGELTLTPDGQSAMRTGMDLAMGAVGLRGVAVKAPAEGGIELAVKTDAMAVRTSSEKVEGLAAAEADVTRLRLGLEGTWRGLKLGTGTLAPSAEIGVRHDGGDAETGFGLDLGGGLSWSDPESGLSAEFRGRGLLTHESKGFRDRGLSGSFAWNPGQGSGRGPKLTLSQTMGSSASGGVDALLGQRHLGGLAANDNGSGDDLANRRLELRLGYGFSALGERFTSTPELGLGLSNGHREYSLGWRLGLTQGGTNALELRIEATRSEAVGANDNTDPEHGIGLRATARW